MATKKLHQSATQRRTPRARRRDAQGHPPVPLTDHTLVVSGRISYEIVHKALTASIGAIVAVSGPTSLAIDLARAHGLVLAGFARGGRVNVYSGDDRVTTEGPA